MWKLFPNISEILMRLVEVNTTVNSVANMIYKSGAIISHLPAK